MRTGSRGEPRHGSISGSESSFGSLTLTGGLTTGTISLTPVALTLVNGANQNVVLPANATIFITTGPTAPYSIGGIAGGASGRFIVIINGVGQQMSINYVDVGSSAANRIANTSLAAIVFGNAYGSVGLTYDAIGGSWIEVFKS